MANSNMVKRAVGMVNRYSATREQNPAFRLLRQDGLPLVAGLIAATFDEANANEFDGNTFETVLEGVIREINSLQSGRDGKQKWPKKPGEYLRSWIQNEGSVNWFIRFRDPAGETQYRLSAHARPAIEFLNSLQDRKTVATDSFMKMFIEIQNDLASILSGNANMRIHELSRQIKNLEDEKNKIMEFGLEDIPLRDIEVKLMMMVRMIGGLNTDLAIAHNSIREHLDLTREIVFSSDVAPGDKLTNILQNKDDIESSDEFESLKAASTLYTDAEVYTALEENKHIILEDEKVREITRFQPVVREQIERGLDSAKKQVNAITREHTKNFEQIRSVVQLDGPEELQARVESQKALKSSLLKLRNISGKTHFNLRDEFGLRISDTRLKAHPVSSISLTKELELVEAQYSAVDVDNIETTEEQNAQSKIELEMLGYCDPAKLYMRMRLKMKQLNKQEILLSEILETVPLKYGMYELMAWLDFANTTQSSIYHPDTVAAEVVNHKKIILFHDPLYIMNNTLRPGTGFEDLKGRTIHIEQIPEHIQNRLHIGRKSHIIQHVDTVRQEIEEAKKIRIENTFDARREAFKKRLEKKRIEENQFKEANLQFGEK